MSRAASKIQVLSPMPKTRLGRFRGRTGVFVIRQNDKLLYVGWSTDVYTTALSYFGRNRSLSNYNIKQVTFEVILCTSIKAKILAKILRFKLKPQHNVQFLAPKLSKYQQTQSKKLLNFYHKESFFETPEGEHKTDNP